MGDSQAVDARQYRKAVLRRFSLTSGCELVYVPASEQVFTMTRTDMDILETCSQFQELENHASRIAQGFSPATDPASVLARLAELREVGALVSRSNLLQLCRRQTDNEETEPPEVQWLVVPTRSRPSGLASTLRSYVGNIVRHGHRVRVFVSDQTPPGERSKGSNSELRSFADEMGVEVWYAGLEEMGGFAATLAAGRDVPPEVVRFALFGLADASANIGASRNAALLHTSGEMVVSVDDDTLCETSCIPGTGPGIRFGGETDPTEAWFFSCRAGSRAFGEHCDIDFLEAHQQILGRRLSHIYLGASSPDRTDLSSICPHGWEHLCSGTGRVLSTYTGLAGDVGRYSTLSFLASLNRGTKERFTSSPEGYLRNMRSREVVRQAPFTTVAHGPGAIGLATCFGLDNRDVLPPFFPPYRSEDGILGQMLAKCHEGAYVCHLPFTIHHDRPEGRTYGDVVTVRVSDLVMGALGGYTPSAAEPSPTDRIVRCGSVLRFVGSLPDNEFRDWLQQFVLARAASICRLLEGALKRNSHQPGFWADDVCRTIERFSSVVRDPVYMVPDEVRGHGGLPMAQQALLRFGEVLQCWPAIVGRTKALRSEGIRIGRQVN